MRLMCCFGDDHVVVEIEESLAERADITSAMRYSHALTEPSWAIRVNRHGPDTWACYKQVSDQRAEMHGGERNE